MRFVYNIVAVLLAICAIPLFIFRSIREPGFTERLRQSWGFIAPATLTKLAGRECLWIHAASVGEIVAANPIIKEIKRTAPQTPVMVSVVTTSGYEMAQRLVKGAEAIIFFPLDLPFLSSSVVKKIRPRAFIMVETELWPNFLQALHKYNIPVMMVNGRISDKSSSRYTYLGSVLREMLDSITMFCMQSELDARYIEKLGADPAKIVITGNTKFDQAYAAISPAEYQQLLHEFGYDKQQPVLIAGSTHSGEEELILQAFCQVREAFPLAQLLLAPRDIGRADELLALSSSCGLTAVRRSKLADVNPPGPVVILDTIGELGNLYSLGDIIFVGGSLITQGGHNVLEPAAHGKPIIVGPYMFNFKESYALLSRRGACITVHDGRELAAEIIRVLRDDDVRTRMGTAALAIVRENGGAAVKTMKQIRSLLQL